MCGGVVLVALGSKLVELRAKCRSMQKSFFSAQQRELFLLYVEPVQPTVTQLSFHVPSPICAPEGGNEEEEEETQAEGGESESMRQLDATLTPSTLLLELCLSTLFSVLIFH